MLPRETIALMHYVNLDKAGWYEQALHRMVVSHLWQADRPQSAAEISLGLRFNAFTSINEAELHRILAQLCRDRELRLLRDNTYEILPARREKYEASLDNYLELEASIKSEFESYLCIEPNTAPAIDWQSFLELFLVPFVADTGAEAISIITGVSAESATRFNLEPLLSKLSTGDRLAARLRLMGFLDAKRAQLLDFFRVLTQSYFVYAASFLNAEQRDTISSESKKRATFCVYLDTNLLMSALNIRENPANQSVRALLDLKKVVAGRVHVQFRVRKETEEELRDAIANLRLKYKGAVVTPANAGIFEKYVHDGVLRQMAKESLRRSAPVTIDQLLFPYSGGCEVFLNDLEVVRDIDEITSRPKRLRMHQDAESIMEESKRSRNKKKHKDYQKAWHDSVLRNVALNLRNNAETSISAIKYWVATIDNGLIRYDDGHKKSLFPTCIHPWSLVKILQLWVPRNAQMEEILLNCIKMPLYSVEYDDYTEDVRNRIARQVSIMARDEYSPSVVQGLFENEILISNLKEAPEDRESQLVQDAAIASSKEREDLADARRQAAEERAKRVEQEAAEQQAIHEAQIQALMAERDTLVAQVSTQGEEEPEDDPLVVHTVAVAAKGNERSRSFAVELAIRVLLIASMGALGWTYGPKAIPMFLSFVTAQVFRVTPDPTRISSCSFLVLAALLLIMATVVLSSLEEVQASAWFRKYRPWIYGGLVGLATLIGFLKDMLT